MEPGQELNGAMASLRLSASEKEFRGVTFAPAEEVLEYEDDIIFGEEAGPSKPRQPGAIEVHKFSHHPKQLWNQWIRDGVKRCEGVRPIALSKKPSWNKIRFVCISDTHNKLHRVLEKIPPGDVLIHAGDFTARGRINEVARFNEDLGKLPHPYKIVIAGNHELSFDPDTVEDMDRQRQDLRRFGLGEGSRPQDLLTNCTYLEDSGTSLFGYKFWGSPWQPVFGGWAFNLDRGRDLLEKWDLIPEDTDVLITHGPPLGHGDLAKNRARAGCVELLETVERRVKPRYHVFGHIHEAHGMTTNGETTFINASICTLSYSPDQDPIVFDLPLKEGFSKKPKKSAGSCFSCAESEETSLEPELKMKKSQ